LGINNGTLFPDLNGLANSLKEGFDYLSIGPAFIPKIEEIFTLPNTRS